MRGSDDYEILDGSDVFWCYHSAAPKYFTTNGSRKRVDTESELIQNGLVVSDWPLSTLLTPC